MATHPAFRGLAMRGRDARPQIMQPLSVRRGKFKNYGGRQLAINLPSNSMGDWMPVNGNAIVSGLNGVSNYGRYSGRGGRHGSSRRHDRQSSNGSECWFRVEIANGKYIGKTQVLKAITDSVRVPFVPYLYEESAALDVACFYVNSFDVISAMKLCRNEMKTPDGNQLQWYFQTIRVPLVTVDTALKDAVAKEMSDCYEFETKALDLSAFRDRQSFLSAGLFVPLDQLRVAELVVTIIKDHIPDMEALNLSRNRLLRNNPEILGIFKEALPGLKILYVRENGMKKLGTLSGLEGWRLVELNLEGNPVSVNEAAEDYDGYVRRIREIFPFLERLDGRKLPRRSRDLDLPRVLPGNGSSAEGRELAVRFLTEYLDRFDGDDRGTLAEAYHEHAVFSMSCPSKDLEKSPFLAMCRNLKMRDDHFTRVMQVARGQRDVVSALRKLPRVKHDLASLIIDVPVVAPILLAIEVCGSLSDADGKLLHFSRTFVLVPNGGGDGVRVTNDIFFASVSPGHWKEFVFQGPQELKLPTVPGDFVEGANSSPVNRAFVEDVNFSPENRAMIERFAVMSGMKADWASRCLSDNEWNFDVAARTFVALKEAGLVPPEAFHVTP